jgi:predicted ATP-grasp superfamily ATP-dependent carboligase
VHFFSYGKIKKIPYQKVDWLSARVVKRSESEENLGLARILLLDGHSAAALAFTRSLGRAGHWTAVGSARGMFAAASLSKYCRATLEYCDSTRDKKSFISDVLDFARANRIDLIIPITDWTTHPISDHRDLFEHLCSVALPSHHSLKLTSDKFETVQLARSLNVPAPDTWLISRMEDLDYLPELQYPIVVKDRSSARWLENGAVLGSVSYAYSREDLLQRVKERLETATDVLLQRFVAGAGVGFSCFAMNGEIFLPFQWLRIRETDPRGSGSSCRRSMPLDPEILQFSCRLIIEAGFQGIAMVEFKKDYENGRPVLMEINGRPWGSIGLPIASGIDYPRHLAEWYLEGKLPPQRTAYHTGITCRRLVGELGHLENVRRGKPAQWPLPYPNFWKTLVKVAIPWYPGMRYDDISLSDPKPGLAGISKWLHRRIQKKRRAGATSTSAVKGIIHCHSRFSYDGKLELGDLCSLLRKEGFDFVALTEHTLGLDPQRYKEVVDACLQHSDDKFLAIPGLEFRCENGLEMAGLGLPEWLEDKPAAEMVTSIRQAGGVAVWVHPNKRSRWQGPFLDCDAVEVMNGKEDGVLAPNLPLLNSYRRERREGRGFHAIFGLDFHNPRQPRNIWTECEVEALSADAILRSLRQGRFVNRVSHGAMASDGKIRGLDYFVMAGLRIAFRSWSALLRVAPGSFRNALLTASRPVVRVLKRRP